ncbi:Heme peroxidase [Mycena kentingensis (nom. inval.)]|nr:Heme peroxidase [Mycena kentingensis (nom. inval.)]
MDSSDFYQLKREYFLGAYKAVAAKTADPSATDYVPTLVYQARAHLALGNPSAAAALIPAGSENVALKAVAALARYVSAEEGSKEAILEELRDLAVEIEGDDVEGSDRDKLAVRVLAGTAFALSGDVEEALETLGPDTEDLEAVAVVVQIYLSINRADRAKKEFERAKNWAEDDLLLQLIESSIGLVAAKDGYSNANSFYTEQLGNPSLSSPHILTARGVTRILRNEISEAKSDLEESLDQQKTDAETRMNSGHASLPSTHPIPSLFVSRSSQNSLTLPAAVLLYLLARFLRLPSTLIYKTGSMFVFGVPLCPTHESPQVVLPSQATLGCIPYRTFLHALRHLVLTDFQSNGTAVANGANGNANGHSVEESHQSLSGPAAAPKILQGLREQVAKGANVLNTSVLSSVVDTIRHRDSIDDRTLALEHGISFVSKMPEGKLATTMQNKIIELFYNDLSHPHATNIGNQYAWRTADGGQNNVNVPDMGRAGTPYARSVQQSHPLPKHEMPDASLVFDALLKRDGFVQHPAGLSSLMVVVAALVIHSVFRTSHTDVNVNETSSYVDLSPLYGVDQTEQDRVRRKEAGLGLLHPDVFAEDRLLLLPPAVCGLLVLFSRNHNYIANRIYEINERGTYADPTTLPEEKRAAQDEELFQTARLVNCGWFGSVVFSDYFSAILGLVREGSSWSLNPFGEFRSEDHAIFDRGQGNVCSVEFNCLYRWHATTSQQDEAWVGKVFDDIFDGKAPEEVTPTDFKAAAYKVKKMQPDITHWTFGKLERQADGSFKDEDLANIIKNATDNPAGAFRARGTPASMRLHEMMGIEQNRKWGVCSLNDFRRYLGLKPYASFKEWNPKSEIYEAAEKLYGDIEYLELYVGLQAEEPKPVVEGAGLCPGYTISRAILADAIALTRGDRHFTYDYTPHNLTAWGFADCQRDPHAYGFGSTLGRLFLRTLPNSFTEDSSYAFFPLMTPTAMKTNLTKLHKLEGYDLTRPKDMPPPMIIQDYAQVAEALKSTKYTTAYAARAGRVVKGKGFFIVESDEKRKEVYTKLFGSSDSLDKVATFFRDTTRQLMASATFTLVGGKTCVVDVVRDVLKLVPVYWAAEIAGIELKTKLNPSGSFTPIDLYDMLADIYSFVFLDIEKSKIKVMEARVQTHVDKLLQHVGISRLSVVGTLFKSKKTGAARSREMPPRNRSSERHRSCEHGPGRHGRLDGRDVAQQVYLDPLLSFAD